MLNPEFRLLDPEMEHLERLMSLSGEAVERPTWQTVLKQLDFEEQKKIVNATLVQLNQPGIHTAASIVDKLRENAKAQGVETPESIVYNWPESIFRKLFNHFNNIAKFYVLGVLDAEGIWAGGLLGSKDGGIDILSTFRLIWSDEPELASKQTLEDLAEFCQIVEKRFTASVCGLYIYKDEFIKWRSQGWSSEVLQSFIQDKTVTTYGF